MTQFAHGGLIRGPDGPDVVPVFIEQGCPSYVLTARQVRESRVAFGLLAKLNAEYDGLEQ